jgi:bacillithiol system protein YtxJ
MSAKFVKIETFEQLDELFKRSHDEPVILLKHSNTCGISLDILEQTAVIDGTVNVVVIQENRPISDTIAAKTGHRHQSPQAFVIKDGKPVYHATHYGIDPNEIKNKLAASR